MFTTTSHENHATWACLLCGGCWFVTVVSCCPGQVQGQSCSRYSQTETQRATKMSQFQPLAQAKPLGWKSLMQVVNSSARKALRLFSENPDVALGWLRCRHVFPAALFPSFFPPSMTAPWLYCSCSSQRKSKIWCNLLHLWKESVKSNQMRQIFYMHLARQQRTVPVTCTMFLMLVSVLMAVWISVCIEGNPLVSTAPRRRRWLDAERLCEIGQNCVSSEGWRGK